jgi:hypothetical protein
MQLVQDEDEMEMSDDDRDSIRPPHNKRTRYDNDKLKVMSKTLVEVCLKLINFFSQTPFQGGER